MWKVLSTPVFIIIIIINELAVQKLLNPRTKARPNQSCRNIF